MSLLKRNGFNQQILRRTEQNQMLVFVFSEQNKRIPRVQTANLQNLQPLLFAKFAHKTAFGAVQLAVPDPHSVRNISPNTKASESMAFKIIIPSILSSVRSLLSFLR